MIKSKLKNKLPDSRGYFGRFGGRFLPETLINALYELEKAYSDFRKDNKLQKEFDSLLKNYVGRPTPVYFAEHISKEIGINIFLKREDLAHTGSHKLNNSLGQALLAKFMGKKRLIAETGAGQHGVATATAAALFGMQCTIYMGSVDVERQSTNVKRMNLLGAEVIPVLTGSRTLKDATNEAFKDWVKTFRNTHYSIGSVVGAHPFPMIVRDFQSVIGREASEQIKKLLNKEKLDYAVACVGGGKLWFAPDSAWLYYLSSTEQRGTDFRSSFNLCRT